MRLLLSALLAFGPIATAEAATVVVTMEAVESATGIVNAALCDKSLSEEGCPISQQR